MGGSPSNAPAETRSSGREESARGDWYGGAVDGSEQPSEQLLTPAEVAAMFRVNPKTVTRWARSGKISAIRTLGGHRRFRESEIRRLLEQVDESN